MQYLFLKTFYDKIDFEISSLEIVFVILVHKHLTGCNECWVVVHSDAILTCHATPMTLLATSVQPMQLAGLGWRHKCASRPACETSMQPQGFPAATAEKDQMFCRKSTITLFQLTNDYFKQQNWSLINFSESSIHPVWIYMIVAQCWHLHKQWPVSITSTLSLGGKASQILMHTSSISLVMR